MTKEKLRRLICLHGSVSEDSTLLEIEELREYALLWREFEAWEPEAAIPEPANPVGAAPIWKILVPNANQSPPAACTCGCAWWGRRPPCPVHGPASTPRVTY